jgi:hypothetical protein
VTAKAAVVAFRGALPAAVAAQNIVDWAADVAADPIVRAFVRGRFPMATVGAALDAMADEVQGHVDSLNGSIGMYCN